MYRDYYPLYDRKEESYNYVQVASLGAYLVTLLIIADWNRV